MMFTLRAFLIVCAVICFLIAAFKPLMTKPPRPEFVALGFAFLTAAYYSTL